MFFLTLPIAPGKATPRAARAHRCVRQIVRLKYAAEEGSMLAIEHNYWGSVDSDSAVAYLSDTSSVSQRGNVRLAVIALCVKAQNH